MHVNKKQLISFFILQSEFISSSLERWYVIIVTAHYQWHNYSNKCGHGILQAIVVNDVQLSPDTKSLFSDKHIDYIANHGKDNAYEYHMTEFLRMSGIYWGVTALDTLGSLEKLDRQEIIDFIRKCQCPQTGGIAACVQHDPHILYTLSAVQILCIYDCLNEIDVDGVAKYITSLQQPDGSFFGDKWGEVDTRFSFCAVATLTLIVSYLMCFSSIGHAIYFWCFRGK